MLQLSNLSMLIRICTYRLHLTRTPLVLFRRSRTKYTNQSHPHRFPFEEDVFEQLNEYADQCGFTDLMEQTNTFPPKGPIKVPEILQLNATSTTLSSFGNDSCYLQYFVQACMYFCDLSLFLFFRFPSPLSLSLTHTHNAH